VIVLRPSYAQLAASSREEWTVMKRADGLGDASYFNYKDESGKEYKDIAWSVSILPPSLLLDPLGLPWRVYKE
jgi:hypothetical protein